MILQKFSFVLYEVFKVLRWRCFIFGSTHCDQYDAIPRTCDRIGPIQAEIRKDTGPWPPPKVKTEIVGHGMPLFLVFILGDLYLFEIIESQLFL